MNEPSKNTLSCGSCEHFYTLWHLVGMNAPAPLDGCVIPSPLADLGACMLMGSKHEQHIIRAQHGTCKHFEQTTR